MCVSGERENERWAWGICREGQGHIRKVKVISERPRQYREGRDNIFPRPLFTLFQNPFFFLTQGRSQKTFQEGAKFCRVLLRGETEIRGSGGSLPEKFCTSRTVENAYQAKGKPNRIGFGATPTLPSPFRESSNGYIHCSYVIALLTLSLEKGVTLSKKWTFCSHGSEPQDPFPVFVVKEGYKDFRNCNLFISA